MLSMAFGLMATGVVGTIGTSAGFNPFTGVFLGLFLGGIFSIPFVVVFCGLIWLRAAWVDRHPILFVGGGAVLTCGVIAAALPEILPFAAVGIAVAGVTYLLRSFMAARRAAKKLTPLPVV